MSRESFPLDNKNTQVHRGSDHALGAFLDITDRRFASCSEDEQGEGYVMEYSTVFGFSTNLIEATVEDIKHPEATRILQEKVDKFIKSLEEKGVQLSVIS